MNNKFKNVFTLGGFIITVIIAGLVVHASNQRQGELQLSRGVAAVSFGESGEGFVSGNPEDVQNEGEDKMIVFILGAVNEPGVVRVKNGARLYEVVALAGGPAEGADLGKVNLASYVWDEEKIVIPYRTASDKTSGANNPETISKIMPEVNLEVKPEVKPEGNAEVKPEGESEVIPKVNLEINPKVNPDANPGINPEITETESIAGALEEDAVIPFELNYGKDYYENYDYSSDESWDLVAGKVEGGSSSSTSSYKGTASSQSKRININTASESELTLLNGIGTATAAKIMEYRNAHGPFQSVEEIKNVKGIGEAKFEKIKNNITV